jgi:RNA polymerase sigma-70 factor (ECF subfamily)
MSGREESRSGLRPLVYCLIPAELAPRLHDLLRRHFHDDASVEVVVERRDHDRRVSRERRSCTAAAVAVEQRLLRNIGGRRVGDRRALQVELSPSTLELPRRARPYAARLTFIERLEPSTEQAEDLDTARLVLRFQSGDRSSSFAELYARYFDRVYGYVRVALKSSTEAEDATQEIFLRVLEALPRYERRSSPFSAWLFTIVRNHLRRQLERRSRIELVDPMTIAEGGGCGDEEAGLRALRWISDKDLLLFIERLPLDQRQVLVLRYVLDMSHQQTAAVLGYTPEKVRKLQSRALQFLRMRLASVGRVPGRARPSMVRRVRNAQVLRLRRFALRG